MELGSLVDAVHTMQGLCVSSVIQDYIKCHLVESFKWYHAHFTDEEIEDQGSKIPADKWSTQQTSGKNQKLPHYSFPDKV